MSLINKYDANCRAEQTPVARVWSKLSTICFFLFLKFVRFCCHTCKSNCPLHYSLTYSTNLSRQVACLSLGNDFCWIFQQFIYDVTNDLMNASDLRIDHSVHYSVHYLVHHLIHCLVHCMRSTIRSTAFGPLFCPLLDIKLQSTIQSTFRSTQWNQPFEANQQFGPQFGPPFGALFGSLFG